MKQGRPKRRPLLVLAYVTAIALLGGAAFASLYQPARQIAHVSPAPTPAPSGASTTVEKVYGLPVRLRVSSLKIDAKVADMGVNRAGEMDVPANLVDVGWYKYGPHPGNPGSAVIAGHLDGYDGKDGVFINLDGLKPGDQIQTVDDTGQTATFAVTRTQTYDQAAHPAEVFTSNEGAHLNLITCIGAWSKTQKRYAQRLVVFADRIN